MTDWKALCAELISALADFKPLNNRELAALDRARAALAQPEPEVVGPTDEELLGLDELEESWNAQADAANSWDELGIDEIIAWAQRQALARYAHQPAPPAEGEVAELVAWLRGCADDHCGHGRRQLTRAADLLERRQTAPVPVSERLPGPEDCDAEERCWLLVPRWILPPQELTHWLPASALPLPAGEVE